MKSDGRKGHAASVAVYTDGEVIGDGIIKIPFASALKSAFPDARLTWLTAGKTVYDGVLRDLASPAIDEIIALPRATIRLQDLFTGSLWPDRHFDVLIDTQTNLRRSLWLKRQVRHATFVSATARFALSDVSPAYSARSPLVIEHLMRLASSAARRPLDPIPVTLSDPKWSTIARALLPPGLEYIGFVVGAGHPKKRWPLTSFVRLALAKAAHGFMPVFLLGPDERDLETDIRHAVPQALFPLSNTAITPLDAVSPSLTIALAARLLAAVANDSGGGHLVAAGGSPMVSLFRSPSVRSKFTPSAPRVAALAPQDFGGESMDTIPFEAAADALEQIIAFARSQPRAAD